jgi:hypothetical protein
MTVSYPPAVSPPRQRIGIWTTGTTAWSAEAYRRIYERELLARLPDAHVHFASDLPDEAVAVSERGDIVMSLAARVEDSHALISGLVVAGADTTDLASVARSLNEASSEPLTLILSALGASGQTVDTDGPAAQAIAEAADVSVRDSRSLDRVRPLRPDHSIALVPDPLVLLDRLTGPQVARSRIEYLRTMDRYPHTGTVIVEVSSSRTSHLAMLGARVEEAIARGYRIAVVALPMDGESMTSELRQHVERTFAAIHVLDTPTLDDRIAAIATSTAVVPLSTALFTAGCAFARPSFRCDEASWHCDATVLPGVECLVRQDFDAVLQIPTNSSTTAAWQMQADAHFDRIAALLSRRKTNQATAEASSAGRFAQIEAAQRMTGRRLADERLRFAQRIEGLLAEIADLKSEIARRSALEAALREEMAGAFALARQEASRVDQLRRNETSGMDVIRLRQLETANQTLEARDATMKAERAAMAETLTDLTRERDELRRAVDRFLRSKSWRYLAPARSVGKALRRWFGNTQ